MYRHKNDIASFGTKSLGLFGSFVRDEANSDSDVDFVVEFLPGLKTYDNFINLAYYLEDILGRKVELLTPNSMSKYLEHHISKTIEYVPIS